MKKTWLRFGRADFTILWRAGSRSEFVAWRVRAERRLGRGDPSAFAAQSDQEKSRVCIKRRQQGDEVYILCLSEGREEKDRAIRESHEQRLKKDLGKLQARIEKGQLQEEKKIHPGHRSAPGTLPAGGPLLPRMDYQAEGKTLTWQEDSEKKPSRKNWTAAMC